MFAFLSPFLRRDHGILGLNARSLLYIRPYNSSSAFRLADNKLKTKAFLTARGIPAAKMYARIENREMAREFDYSQLPDECVLKPNFGFGGEGIIIFRGRKKGQFLKNGKVAYDNEQIIEHIEDILDGKFSLGGRRDTAFFEQILHPHECFARFRPAGLPDIRIIVFNMVPVMAMLRIPTKDSDGKANVHLGGIGIGIDIAKGTTTHAAQYHHMITVLPHGESVAGIPIPHWEEILLISSRIQQMTDIGYLAVDITIDQHMGPALLEVNARAGLMVQVANLAPLRRRLERVQGIRVGTPEKGVRLGQDLFGEKVRVSSTKENASDAKTVLGMTDTISIVGSGETVREPCLIDATAERTLFTEDFLKELASIGAAEPAEDQDAAHKVKFTLGGKKIQTLVGASSVLAEGYRVCVGRRDLAGFLIDPTKKPARRSGGASYVRDVRAVDRLFEQADRELLLLKHLRPVNAEQERARAERDSLYCPVFLYAEPPDLDDLERRIADPVRDESPIGSLLEKKRVELLKKIALLRARGSAQAFTQASVDLFGKPGSALVRAANAQLHHRRCCALPAPRTAMLNADRAAERMREALDAYSLHDWQVIVRPNLVSNCAVGGRFVYIRSDAEFEETYIEGLIKHEIETHVLTSENGEHQPYALLRRGCANYLDTQEGLAIWNQNLIYGEDHERRYHPAKNVLAVAFGLTHSFAETRRYLAEELGYSFDKALGSAISLKRGLADTSEPGAFTKGICYFRGWRAVDAYARKGGDIAGLYVGKIALEDIDVLRRIPELTPPVLLPNHLRGRKITD